MKKLKLLTNEQQKPYEYVKICYILQQILYRYIDSILYSIYYICKEKFADKYVKDKKYRKVRDYCPYRSEYRGTAHSIYNLKYSILNEIIIYSYNFSRWI